MSWIYKSIDQPQSGINANGRWKFHLKYAFPFPFPFDAWQESIPDGFIRNKFDVNENRIIFAKCQLSFIKIMDFRIILDRSVEGKINPKIMAFIYIELRSVITVSAVYESFLSLPFSPQVCPCVGIIIMFTSVFIKRFYIEFLLYRFHPSLWFLLFYFELHMSMRHLSICRLRPITFPFHFRCLKFQVESLWWVCFASAAASARYSIQLKFMNYLFFSFHLLGNRLKIDRGTL